MNRKIKIKKSLLIPKYHSTSPRGGRRACLCWDTNTYSIECCDGSLRAQGIGSIYRTS